jgi:hypothetical protein
MINLARLNLPRSGLLGFLLIVAALSLLGFLTITEQTMYMAKAFPLAGNTQRINSAL